MNIFNKIKIYRYVLTKLAISLQPTLVKKILARNYWQNKSYDEKDGSAYDTNKGHKFEKVLEILGNKFNLNKINSVLEFGSNRPLNLSFLAEQSDFKRLIGIDISKNVFYDTEILRKNNYTPILGNVNELYKFKNNSIDLSFTWSVLDHIPDKLEVTNIITNLIRISKTCCLFIEPYIEGVEVDASLKSRGEIKKQLVNSHKTFYKFSYFWDYKKIFNDMKQDFICYDMPLHYHSLGPFYKIFLIQK